MNPIKRKIIDSATKVFSEKGFHSTSVQEIVEDCGIAKGMLYKYFSSKEDLFMEIFDNCQKNFAGQAQSILNEKNTEPKERLKKAIVHFLEFFQENRYILIKTFMPENDEITKLKKVPREWLLNWHKDCLLKTYGEVISENIWDLVMIFKGVQKEYLNLLIEKDLFLPIADVSSLIVKSMDALVKDVIEFKSKPIITPAVAKNHLISELGEDFNNSQGVLDDILDTILLTLDNVKKKSRHEELFQSMKMLGEEIKQNQPRWFLVYALLSYLEDEDLIAGLVRQSKKYIRTLEKNMAEK